MLGTLAHRSLLLSFQRQWSAGDLARRSIVDRTAANVELLTYAASVRKPDAPGSLLRAIIDPGGPAWGGAADAWVALSSEDRAWVLDVLPKAAEEAAHLLAEDDSTQRYRSLRSEVRLNRLDATDAGVVADLVGFTQDGRIVLVDLKFIHAGFPVFPDSHTRSLSQVRTQMRLARESLRAPGSARCTRRVEGWLLYIAYQHNESAWEKVA